MQKKILLIPLALVLVVSLIACAAPAPAPTAPAPAATVTAPAPAPAEAEYKWRMAAGIGPLINESLDVFCDLINVYSDGRIEVELYPDDVLGGLHERFHGVQDGSIEMGSLFSYSDIVPGGMLCWMPFTTETYDEAAIAFHCPDGILFKVMTEAWKEVGVHLLWQAPEGQIGISNTVRPLKTPDDFKDWKFRVSADVAAVRAFENMGKGTGMTLETIPWTDLYNALERGVVDACWNSYSQLIEQRHFEVVKYYTPLGFEFASISMVINKGLWEQLPRDLQGAILRAGEVAELHGYEAYRRGELEFRKTALEAGVEIYDITAEERSLFREKANMPAIWEEICKPWLEEHYPGQNMAEKVLNELERIKAKLG